MVELRFIKRMMELDTGSETSSTFSTETEFSIGELEDVPEDLHRFFESDRGEEIESLKTEGKSDDEASSSSYMVKTSSSTITKNLAIDISLADQEQQTLLIDKIKTKLGLNAWAIAQTTGNLIDLDDPIKDIAKKIYRLDRVELKALEQSFDYLTDPSNYTQQGDIKLTPTAIPLLPLGVQVMSLVFGAMGAYLVGKAVSETGKILKDYQKTKAYSKEQDLLEKKIHEDTLAAKVEMASQAKELTDRNKNPDLCNSLRSKTTELQAQHFTDIGYGIFQVVKELYPGAYYSKHPATGAGIGIHTATKIYGEGVVKSCEIKGWLFEKSLKDGKPAEYGSSGYSRNDMLHTSLLQDKETLEQEIEEKTIFDIKTGNATLTIEEAQKRHNNLFTVEEKKDDLQLSMHSVYEITPLGGHPKPVIIKGQVVPPTPKPTF